MKNCSTCLLGAVALIVQIGPALASDNPSDPLYEKCKDLPRNAWCYEEAVEARNEPAMCENIIKYWPRAEGVHGWCYYQLAMKNKDCSLCGKIHKGDIRTMCTRDVCK